MNIYSSTEPQVVRRTSSVLRFGTNTTLRNISRAILLPIALLCTTAAFAQNPSFAIATPETQSLLLSHTALASTSDTAALPEDPSARLIDAPAISAPQLTPQAATMAGPVAPKYSMTISAGFKAQPLTSHDKVIAGLRDLYSPATLVGEITSAGYSHVTNGEPNYGTNATAFGKRYGASVLRDTNEILFSEVILAPAFHEDPRYYVEGPQYNFFHRTLYSVTRPIITRTDHGRSTINASVLVGYAGASAISYAYYPAINQNFKDTAATFGGSLAGAAIGDFVSEFIDDVFQAFHLEKKR